MAAKWELYAISHANIWKPKWGWAVAASLSHTLLIYIILYRPPVGGVSIIMVGNPCQTIKLNTFTMTADELMDTIKYTIGILWMYINASMIIIFYDVRKPYPIQLWIPGPHTHTHNHCQLIWKVCKIKRFSAAVAVGWRYWMKQQNLLMISALFFEATR